MDSLCPTLIANVGDMKIKHLVEAPAARRGNVVACFGGAALIRGRKGRWTLEGGSRNDRLEAQEWISLFLHEAVVKTE
jgi:hypothetical protein